MLSFFFLFTIKLQLLSTFKVFQCVFLYNDGVHAKKYYNV